MTNDEFWSDINAIIAGGFNADGLKKLDYYAELFINGQIVYQRFSPLEQHGCAAGGATNVIASLIAGAEDGADCGHPRSLDFKEECQRGTRQAARIEQWARQVGVWTDGVDHTLPRLLGEQIAEGGEAKVYNQGSSIIKAIGLEYFIQPLYALDRITLHNAYFPETSMTVVGFGRDSAGEFKVLVEQSFIIGGRALDEEIADYMRLLGFTLRNPSNWTYTSPDIYLSDVHDENVIRSASGRLYVIDCDIRLNTPAIRQGGQREERFDVVVNL